MLVETVISTILKHRLYKKSHLWVMLCPFHKEIVPSCALNTNTKTYSCAGCGKSGPLSDIDIGI
jgi:DNA primase